MGLFEDLSQFLEMRLEEFLQNNPHLELLALEEGLRDQEAEVNRLLIDLNAQLQQVQSEIRLTAEEVKRWHFRVDKAKSVNRQDLSDKAQEREVALLHQGNQQWSRMQLLRERIRQSQELLLQTQARRQEIRAKAAEVKTTQTQAEAQSRNRTWPSPPPPGSDPLEAAFSRWEADLELEELKRNLGR
jgi:uncharacterized protein (TIGR04376 family)